MIKVLSLTLGLGVGLILFARVAFELSFDTFFDQVEDLYSVHVRYNDDKTGEEDGSRILFAPIPEALRQEFPEIQYATVCRRRYGAVLYHGEDRFKPRLMMADSLFFRTAVVSRSDLPCQIYVQPFFPIRKLDLRFPTNDHPLLAP